MSGGDTRQGRGNLILETNNFVYALLLYRLVL
jgi:hypothetical protein